jgi:hypothetical protein
MKKTKNKKLGSNPFKGFLRKILKKITKRIGVLH